MIYDEYITYFMIGIIFYLYFIVKYDSDWLVKKGDFQKIIR